MSHCVSIAIVLKDIAAVKAAAEELGMNFLENQKTYTWWGTKYGGGSMPAGFTAADAGKCEHALGIEGNEWHVGVVKLKDGTGYTLIWDGYGHHGGALQQALGGPKAEKFTQLYGVHKATLEARRRGHSVVRNLQPNGAIRLVIQVREK